MPGMSVAVSGNHSWPKLRVPGSTVEVLRAILVHTKSDRSMVREEPSRRGRSPVEIPVMHGNAERKCVTAPVEHSFGHGIGARTPRPMSDHTFDA